MNYQEQLLKNYILSEVYSIEKKDLLEEGKVFDWFKDKINDVKLYFVNDPNFQNHCKKSIAAAEKKGDKRSKENWKKASIAHEELKSKRLNRLTAGTIFLIALTKLIPTGGTIQDVDPNRADALINNAGIERVAREVEERGSFKQMSRDEMIKNIAILVGEDEDQINAEIYQTSNDTGTSHSDHTINTGFELDNFLKIDSETFKNAERDEIDSIVDGLQKVVNSDVYTDLVVDGTSLTTGSPDDPSRASLPQEHELDKTEIFTSKIGDLVKACKNNKNLENEDKEYFIKELNNIYSTTQQLITNLKILNSNDDISDERKQKIAKKMSKEMEIKFGDHRAVEVFKLVTDI